jgi:hypothetical protein
VGYKRIKAAGVLLLGAGLLGFNLLIVGYLVWRRVAARRFEHLKAPDAQHPRPPWP